MISCLLVSSAVVAALLLTSFPTRGQDDGVPSKAKQKAAEGKGAKSGATPRQADGKVDLSGLWTPDRNFIYDISDALKPGAKPPTQPWADKRARERMSKDDPEANCLPTGSSLDIRSRASLSAQGCV